MHNQPKTCKCGVTLIEVCIGALLLSIILTIVMNLFAGGLKGSNKGMAHLTNMNSAAVIMAQIENDILRATKIMDPTIETTETAARWELQNEDGTTSTIIYNLLPNGLERKEDSPSSGKKNHIFGRDLNLKIRFRHLEFLLTKEKTRKEGMWVELKVSTNSKNDEEFSLNRLVLSRNLVSEI